MLKLKDVIEVIGGEFTVRLADKIDYFGNWKRQSAIYHDDLKKFYDFEVSSISSGTYEVGTRGTPISESFVSIVLEDKEASK